MRPIHTTKRLYSIAASPPLKSSVRPTPTSPRPRRASLSLASAVGPPSSASASSTVVTSPANRSLYTNASGQLYYFDSASTPLPPTSRTSNSHILPTFRQSVSEAQTQTTQGNATGNGSNANGAQTPHAPNFANGAQQTQQNHHGQSSGGQQAEGGSQPLFGTSSLMLSLGGPAPHSGSSLPEHGFLLGGPRSSLAADRARRSRDSVADDAERQTKEEQSITRASSTGSQKIYQLDVGAYGIPKRGRGNGRGRPCACPTCIREEEVFALDSLDSAVQIGEDAYFVRENALGVADGVGGWSSRASSNRVSSSMHSCSTCAAASTSFRHHASGHRHPHRTYAAQPSPSALFARRLMHFCAHEVGEARASAASLNSTLPVVATQNSETKPKTAQRSLKNGGIASPVTMHGRQKTVVREHGNATPFVWPWEAESNLGVSIEEDLEKSTVTLESSNETSSSAYTDAKGVQDPLEGTVDPVDVLERAYSKTIDAHRVRRRVRIVKTQMTAPRWWPYGLGLGSVSPAPTSTSSHDTMPAVREKLDECEWEWQENWEPLTVGSSTALLAVLSGDCLRIAHLGDCVGWLVRAGEVVWRSEEMWWGFNYPVQLGPSSPSRPSDARRYELSVQADDILILASDGVSDNCWEEDVLDEVRRAVEAHLPLSQASDPNNNAGVSLFGRRTLAAMLSEALCSRARQLSTQTHGVKSTEAMVGCTMSGKEQYAEAEELPFARRAREEGRSFRGGKCDDISVLVAIISPVSQTTSEIPAVSPERQSEPVSTTAELEGSASVLGNA